MKTFFYTLSLLVWVGFISCQGKTNEKLSTENKLEVKNNLDENPIRENNNITFSGKVLGYHTKNSACFFVDQEMVAKNITDNFEDKADSGICTDQKYGKGIPVFFSELDKTADYPTPPDEDTLIIIKGYWKTETYQGKENVAVLHVTQWEPFF